MKRIFQESRIYDYSTLAEATKHMAQMKEKGWSTLNDHPVTVDQVDYPYTMEYYRYK